MRERSKLGGERYGRYITSDGWFVLNLGDALAVRNEEKGGAEYPLEPREHPFDDVGVHVRVLWSGDPNALYHCEGAQEGFLVLWGECTLIVEEEERQLRQWDYFHCPADTRHVIVGAGDGPCAILMIGARPDERIRYPVSEVAAKYGASAAKETGEPDEVYVDWPGEYQPMRPPWPVDSEAKLLRNRDRPQSGSGIAAWACAASDGGRQPDSSAPSTGSGPLQAEAADGGCEEPEQDHVGRLRGADPGWPTGEDVRMPKSVLH